MEEEHMEEEHSLTHLSRLKEGLARLEGTITGNTDNIQVNRPPTTGRDKGGSWEKKRKFEAS